MDDGKLIIISMTVSGTEAALKPLARGICGDGMLE